jgi:hypothetical protein
VNIADCGSQTVHAGINIARPTSNSGGPFPSVSDSQGFRRSMFASVQIDITSRNV